LRQHLRSPSWPGKQLHNICAIDDNTYLPFVEITIWSFPHSWLITGFAHYIWYLRFYSKTGATSGSGIAYPSGASWSFSRVRVAQSVVFCVMFCRSLFDLFSLFFWSLYYRLSIFDLRLLITPLVSFNERLWHKSFKIYQPTNKQMEQNITMLNPKWRKDMFFCSMIKHVLVVSR
jgi:hypothetical protein